MKADKTWDRLARAALDARDVLRSGLLPKIEECIKRPERAAELLPVMRTLAANQAESLKAALKNPE